MEPGTSRDNRTLVWAWKGALLCFMLAAATGVMFRVGMLEGLPYDLQFENVRHAHSHLMYFGWVTPALMAMIASHIERPGVFSGVIWIIFFLALGSYTPFLLYGYGPAAVGEMRLPLSVIFAGANIIGWYTFAVLYYRKTRTVERTRTIRLFDGGLIYLMIASLGAWLLAPVMMLRPENPFWFQAALHLFLDLFADGWLTLALLGFAYTALEDHRPGFSRWGIRLLLTGLPVTFLLGIPIVLVPEPVRLIGSAGGILAAVGLLLVVSSLWNSALRRETAIWTVPLALLGVKALAQLTISIPRVASWAEGMNLRILYLHILLLGFVTLGLLAAAKFTWSTQMVRTWPWFATAVIVLLLSLLPLTGLWPAGWRGPWVYYAAAVGACLPLIAAAGVYANILLTIQTPTSIDVPTPEHPD